MPPLTQQYTVRLKTGSEHSKESFGRDPLACRKTEMYEENVELSPLSPRSRWDNGDFTQFAERGGVC